MLFSDRVSAGKLLAEEVVRRLSRLSDKTRALPVVVVALPRGGAPVAYEVARRLSAPLEIIAAKKLPFPNEPEYAMGAVSSEGVVVLNASIPHSPDWKAYVERESQKLLASTKERENRFYELSGTERKTFENKVVIVIDDGVATGMTAACALKTAKQRGATHLIMAAPVMSQESVRLLSKYADEVISLRVPALFNSVGQHYLNFEQTTDQEVVTAMRNASHQLKPTWGLAN
ncbi:MAG: hypothetical protein DKT66_05635 [Candidatus Melainabacteria bacterium]|nr:MAG: hypothetical protein DKT66_05635 [Candidatus Melainabacteria bacterium]